MVGDNGSGEKSSDNDLVISEKAPNSHDSTDWTNYYKS